MIESIILFFLNIVKLFIKGKSHNSPNALIKNEPMSTIGDGLSLYDRYRQLYFTSEFLWDSINIIGIRDEKDLEKGIWNDLIIVCYIDKQGNEIVEEFKGTTDPSAHHTKVLKKWKYGNKNVDGIPQFCTGAGHLQEGYYKFKVGMHRKSYPALVQAEKFLYYADMNSYDKSKWKLCYDYGGCNMHYGLGKGNRIWLASALCQVIKGIAQWKKFWEIISIFERQRPGQKYGYLLTTIDKYKEINKKL